MLLNLISGGWNRNSPWGTEFAFEKGLNRLGHVTSRVDSNGGLINIKADANIIFKHVNNDTLRRDLSLSRRIPTIIYQPDDMRFDHIIAEMKDMIELIPSACAAIFERDGVDKSLELGFKDATRILLPVDDEVFRKINTPKIFDVCFIGNISNDRCHDSRRKMVSLVSKLGYRCAFTSTFDIPTVVKIYNSSRVVIHHATDVGQQFGKGYGYQSRHFEAGFCGSCVLSNEVVNELQIPGLSFFNSEESLESCLEHLLNNEIDGEGWNEYGNIYYQQMMNYYKPEVHASHLIKFIEKVRQEI